MKKTIIFIAIFIVCLVSFFCLRNVFKKNIYHNIVFDSNNGTPVNVQKVLDGSSIEIPEEPKRDGYIFVGWSYDDEFFDVYSNIHKSIKLLAKWVKRDNNYIVKFDSNGGSFVENQVVNKDFRVVMPEAPIKEGYVFDSWYLGTEEFMFNTLISEDVTLSARWVNNDDVLIKKSNNNLKNYPVINKLNTSSGILEYSFSDNKFNINKTGDNLIHIVEKTIVVNNKNAQSAVFDMKLNNLINTFGANKVKFNSTCIRYSDYNNKIVDGECESLDKFIGFYDSESEESLYDSVFIDSNITHEYKVVITFYDDKDKKFNGDIELLECKLPNLFEVMERDNEIFADNINSVFVNNAIPGIDFSKVNSDTNGKGLYYTTDSTKTDDIDGDGKGERVYYYRGDVFNNNVVFGNYCWKIIRTNEDGSIKMRYSGPYSSDTKCSVVSSLGSTHYNYTQGDNAYTGYMMGIDNQCGEETCYGDVNSTSYEEAHSNKYDSVIKKKIDNWYENNILTKGYSVTSRIANTVYCGDRSIKLKSEGYTGSYTQLAYGSNSTSYGFIIRMDNNNPQYKCNLDNDKFTLREDAGGILGYGNNALKYPIALMSGDEFIYAGNIAAVKNVNNYLYYNKYYWGMSAGTFGSVRVGTIVLDNGAIYNDRVVYVEDIFPVISLYSNTKVYDGTGVSTDPYIIK